MKNNDIGNYLDIAKAKMIESKEILEDAKMLFENQRYMSAANRIYYSVFKAISALHFLDGNRFKKHKDALGQFNKLYIHTGIFPKEFGSKIYKIESAREEADYSIKPKLTKEILEEYLDFATKFIKIIKNYCNKKLHLMSQNNQQQNNFQR